MLWMKIRPPYSDWTWAILDSWLFFWRAAFSPPKPAPSVTSSQPPFLYKPSHPPFVRETRHLPWEESDRCPVWQLDDTVARNVIQHQPCFDQAERSAGMIRKAMHHCRRWPKFVKRKPILLSQTYVVPCRMALHWRKLKSLICHVNISTFIAKCTKCPAWAVWVA